MDTTQTLVDQAVLDGYAPGEEVRKCSACGRALPRWKRADLCDPCLWPLNDYRGARYQEYRPWTPSA